mgnify:CR=1 FL=1
MGRNDPRLHPERRHCPCGDHAARPRAAGICRSFYPLEQRGANRESKGQPACPRDRAALPRELSDEQQLALVRAYVKDNFVDKGMCADFAIHDKGTGNPHVHIMLTLRPLKENGQWGAKCRKAYDLDENGQRIRMGKAAGKSSGGYDRLER